MRILATFLTLTLCGASPVWAQDQSLLHLTGSASFGEWTSHANARYGTVIDYPADHFQPNPPPENGDGRSFSGADGVSSFVAYAHYNVLELPLGGLMAEDVANDLYDEITYRKWDKGWYVLSGYSGANIFYRKVILRPQDASVHVFEITYPKTMKAVYDAAVTRMAASFRSGQPGF